MKKFNIKKYSLMLAVAGVFLTLVGVTYALYSYLGLGSKYISVSSNGVTFSYLESKTGLSLTDAIPKPDEIGKTDSNYFEFYIRANSSDTIEIPYYITTRKTDSSSDIDDAIKLYLTRVLENGNEEEVALVKFADLKQYTNSGIDLSKYTEKLLYNTEVPIGKGRYRETYRLRMWIDYDTNFADSKYNNANFSLKVNVYALGREAGFETVKKYIAKAEEYYDTVKNNNTVKLGTNVIDRLNLNDISENDQLVLTEDGKVEAAVIKNNKCYRKSATSDEIEIVDKEYCINNVDKFVSNNGHLHVCGTSLCNERNDVMFLRGMAAGINEPKYINDDVINTYKNWGANIIRYMVNAKVSWGLYFVGNEDNYINALKSYIDKVIEKDMYVIVNWDPQRNEGNFLTENAKDFFARLTTLYPNDPHIIYEIVNEPLDNNTWQDVKNHANEVIPVIREKSPDAIVLVGTPYYDDKIDVVIDDQLSFDNIMYTFHRYMTQVDSVAIEKLNSTRAAGVPIFVSEWGTMGLGDNSPNFMEANTNAFARYLQKHGYNYILFGSGEVQGRVNDKHALALQGQWSNSLPTSSLTESGLAVKNILLNNLDYFKANLMRDNRSETSNESSTGYAYRSSEWKDKIVSIEFKNKLEIPDNAIVSWDLSMAQDNSVVGYLIETSEIDHYKLIIAANGKIYAPLESGHLFSNLSNLESINFDGFDTKETFYISALFAYDTSLKSLDLSKLDSSMIRRMWDTFRNCKNLTSINFSNWHPTIESIGVTFGNCEKLTSLDLSGFNMSKVTKFENLFFGDKALKTINISTWNPTNVTSIANIFTGCTSLDIVNMSKFSVSTTTNVTDALKNVKTGAKFIVKDQTAIDLLTPTSTNAVTFEISN